MRAENQYVPWRERAFVSIDEAAQIMARCPDWIRQRISGGRLEGVRFTRGAPLVVSVSSLAELIDQFDPVEPESVFVRPPGLHLVIDNT